jgi:hypothetical protein
MLPRDFISWFNDPARFHLVAKYQQKIIKFENKKSNNPKKQTLSKQKNKSYETTHPNNKNPINPRIHHFHHKPTHVCLPNIFHTNLPNHKNTRPIHPNRQYHHSNHIPNRILQNLEKQTTRIKHKNTLDSYALSASGNLRNLLPLAIRP